MGSGSSAPRIQAPTRRCSRWCLPELCGSAWICTRNDVVGNFAVLLAALGVFGTGTGRPDMIVPAVMALLAMQGSSLMRSVVRVDTRGTLCNCKPSPRNVGRNHVKTVLQAILIGLIVAPCFAIAAEPTFMDGWI